MTKDINRELDLAEEASPEATLAAVKTIKNRAAAADTARQTAVSDLEAAQKTIANRDTKIAELEKKIANSEAEQQTAALDAALEKAGVTDETEISKWRELAATNLQAVLDLLEAEAGTSDEEPPKQVSNREVEKHPDANKTKKAANRAAPKTARARIAEINETISQ